MTKMPQRVPAPTTRPMAKTRYGQFVKWVEMQGEVFVMVAHNTNKNWTAVLHTTDIQKANLIFNAYVEIGYVILKKEVE